MLVADLPDRRRTGDPAERAERARRPPSDGRRSRSDACRTRHARCAPSRPGVLEVKLVVLDRRAGELRVVVVERREVGRETVAQRVGVERLAESARSARPADGRSAC